MSTQPMEIKKIESDKIRPGKYQPRLRFDDTYLKELAASMKTIGIMQPILLRPIQNDLLSGAPTLYEIVFGECRWRAATIAGITEIPAMVRELTDLEAEIMANMENLQRKDLHPLEEAMGFQKAIDNGMSLDDLAAELGKSRAYIFGIRKLCRLSPAVKELFLDNKFAPSIATCIARLVTPESQMAVAKITIDRALTVQRVKDLIDSDYSTNLKTASWQLNDTKLVPSAGSCASCPKRGANCKDEFPDIGANVCIDLTCYQSKRDAHTLKRITQAQAVKQTIIQGEEALKIKPDKWGSVKLGWIDVDASTNIGSEYISPRGAFGKKLPPLTLLINPHAADEIISIVQRADIAPLFEAEGYRVPHGDMTKEQTAKESDIDRKIKAERLYREALYHAIRDAENNEQGLLQALLLPHLCAYLWKRLDMSVRPAVNKRMRTHIAEWNASEPRCDGNEDLILIQPTKVLYKILNDMALSDEMCVPAYLREKFQPTPLLLAAAAGVGIDPDAVRTASQEKKKKKAAKTENNGQEA